jgi:hypothetical protein
MLNDKLLESLMAHGKLKKNYIDCLDADDFEGFSKHFKIYIEKTNSGEDKPDLRKANQRIAAIREFADIVISRKEAVDKIIDFFKKAELVSPENMLLSFWTGPENERYFRYNKDHHEFNDKHLEFWSQGVRITKKHYKLYCEVLNKLEFMKPKDEFFSLQDTYILHNKLHTKLQDKPNKSSRIKI